MGPSGPQTKDVFLLRPEIPGPPVLGPEFPAKNNPGPGPKSRIQNTGKLIRPPGFLKKSQVPGRNSNTGKPKNVRTRHSSARTQAENKNQKKTEGFILMEDSGGAGGGGGGAARFLHSRKD